MNKNNSKFLLIEVSKLRQTQSGFRAHHSTKTVLFDVFLSSDNGLVSLPVLIDLLHLCTVSHNIILERPIKCCSIFASHFRQDRSYCLWI